MRAASSREHERAQLLAVERAVCVSTSGPNAATISRKPVAARRDHLARDPVGVDDADVERREQPRDRALAGSDAAREANRRFARPCVTLEALFAVDQDRHRSVDHAVDAHHGAKPTGFNPEPRARNCVQTAGYSASARSGSAAPSNDGRRPLRTSP